MNLWDIVIVVVASLLITPVIVMGLNLIIRSFVKLINRIHHK